MRTVRFMFAEENRGKEIKERIQKDLKQYKKAVILTGMILGTMQILFQTVCPMRILFGIPCPGCGLTHAGWYVITFQWKKAWQWNPTIFLWIFCMDNAKFQKQNRHKTRDTLNLKSTHASLIKDK